MPRGSAVWWIIGLGALVIIVSRTLYVVSETEQVVVTQLGRPVRLVQTPGLHFKLPFLQQLTFFEDRLLDYDAAPAPVITRDKKNLVVDNYAKWQIRDPLQIPADRPEMKQAPKHAWMISSTPKFASNWACMIWLK